MSEDGNLCEIQTGSGRVRGKRNGEVTVFKGIPYAMPPTGTLRFQAPKPVKPWNGTRDAFEFGSAAIQTIPGWATWVYPQPQTMGEDCLTLNIWTPPPSEEPRPVIVWLHGGGHRLGASSMPLYDGSKFAEFGKVVMVTITYRLGIFGWAAHPELRDPDTGCFANWAILDQIEALRWIKENIAAFGGDPDKITVMGQSGGAIFAIMIAHRSIAEPLFHQNILMSAPHICPPAAVDITDWSTVIEALAKELGTTVAGLRSVPAMDLHNAELQQLKQHSVTTDTGHARGAVVDGIVLDEWPAFYGLPKMPTLIGGINCEVSGLFNFFDPISNTIITPPPGDDVDMRPAIQKALNGLYYLGDGLPMIDDVIAHYRSSALADGRSDDMATVAMELIEDISTRHYAVRKAEHAVLNGHEEVYFYQYDLPLESPDQAPAHATELPIVFGTFLHPHYREKIGDGGMQHSVSRAIIESFSAFAATGRPSSDLLPEWPRFRAPAANVMMFGEDNTVGKVVDLPKYRQLSILDELASMRQ